MLRTALLVSGLAFGASACFTASVDEDNYFEQQGVATCKHLKRCWTTYFYSEWDDLEECFDDAEDQRDDNEEYYEAIQDNCDFDEDKAQECLSLYSGSCKVAGEDYDEFYDGACSEVWDCD